MCLSLALAAKDSHLALLGGVGGWTVGGLYPVAFHKIHDLKQTHQAVTRRFKPL